MTGKQGSRHDSKTNILIAFTGNSNYLKWIYDSNMIVIMKIYSIDYVISFRCIVAARCFPFNCYDRITVTSYLLDSWAQYCRYKWFVMEDMWVALTYSTTVWVFFVFTFFCFIWIYFFFRMISIANMIINFIFRADFRQTFFRCMNAAGMYVLPTTNWTAYLCSELITKTNFSRTYIIQHHRIIDFSLSFCEYFNK